MKRALVTGATGFIGANLVRRLLEDGHEIHLLVKPGHQSWRIEEIRDSVRLHEINIEDRARVGSLVGSIRPEWVFHLAVYGAYPSQTDWPQMVSTNILGTSNLLDACVASSFEVFVNTGTSSEYGVKDHAASETEPLDPNSHYAVSKAAGTMHCRYVSRSRAVNVPTLRLYSAYGPYEEPSRLMPNLVTHGVRGELPPLVDPAIARDYVHVADVCEAYVLAATHPHEFGAVYNIGSGIQTTLREVVDTAQRVMRFKGDAKWGSMANRAWDTSVWVADNRKAMEQLGWKPRYAFAEGFAAFVNWFENHSSVQSFYQNSLSARA